MNNDEIKERYFRSTIISLLDDIYNMITWGDFAKEYFSGHSVSWFYNKMRGVDGNGGQGAFSSDELEQLKGGLVELADRIRAAADKIK